VKVCQTCGLRYEADNWKCPCCRATPTHRNGIPVFGSGEQGEETKDAAYLDDDIRAAEARHFWFRSRFQLVRWMLRRYFPDAKALLDAGCGTGFVLEQLRRTEPSLALAGCDVRFDTLMSARRKLPDVTLIAADTLALPYESEFEVVTALDVIEHIDDDCAALAALLKVLKPGGGLILTVPQHQWLWSEVDDFSCHRRRYARSDLEAKVRRAGFEVLRCTSFFAATLPVLAASRLRRRRPFDPAAELKIPVILNAALAGVLDIERAIVTLGLPLPVGSSLLLVGRRPAAA
jgi:ubiquinone/menaquinone biosynthesis C-methylase UbiE